jgi:hypothetical protein
MAERCKVSSKRLSDQVIIVYRLSLDSGGSLEEGSTIKSFIMRLVGSGRFGCDRG